MPGFCTHSSWSLARDVDTKELRDETVEHRAQGRARLSCTNEPANGIGVINL